MPPLEDELERSCHTPQSAERSSAHWMGRAQVNMTNRQCLNEAKKLARAGSRLPTPTREEAEAEILAFEKSVDKLTGFSEPAKKKMKLIFGKGYEALRDKTETVEEEAAVDTCVSGIRALEVNQQEQHNDSQNVSNEEENLDLILHVSNNDRLNYEPEEPEEPDEAILDTTNNTTKDSAQK